MIDEFRDVVDYIAKGEEWSQKTVDFVVSEAERDESFYKMTINYMYSYLRASLYCLDCEEWTAENRAEVRYCGELLGNILEDVTKDEAQCPLPDNKAYSEWAMCQRKQ